MAGWLGPAKQTFYYTDGDGVQKVADGWKLWHYIPDSDTLKDTWQDPSEEDLNSNPVILDENGQAQIFGNGLYRQRFTNADETVEVWDTITVAGASDEASTSTNDYFDMPFEFLGVEPTAGQMIGAFTFVRACQVPADFSGAIDGFAAAAGTQLTAPTAEVVVTVERGTISAPGTRTQIGTITIDTDGDWTWETTGHLPQAFDPDDFMGFFAPDIPDATWADIFWNVPGNVL